MAGFDPRGGKPTNYVLGRGKLYLSGDITRTVDLVNPVADSNKTWRDVGNVTAFTIAQESETKEHRSFLTGIQTIDLEVAVSQKMTLSFTADEINALNLARFLSGRYLGADGNSGGGVPALGNGAGIASNDAVYTTGTENFFKTTIATDQVFDVWYDIELTILGVTYPCIDFEPQGTGASQQNIIVHRNLTNRTTVGAGTLLVEGTDYEIDRKMGRIRFLSGGGMVRGQNFRVNWDASEDRSASAIAFLDDKLFAIQPLTTSGITVGLKFIQENANDGDIPLAYEFWQVKLKPDGELAGIGDDWSQLSFSGVVESVGSPGTFGSPYGRILGRNSFST